MDINIRDTKKNLIFVCIFFSVIFLFSFIFISAKYYKDLNFDKIQFSYLIDDIRSGSFNLSDLNNNKIDDNMFLKRKTNVVDKNSFFEKNGFINYIFTDSNNSIISSDIKDKIKENLLYEILDDSSFFSLKNVDGFLIKKFNINNGGNLILLKEVNYNFSQYLLDILTLLFINILFVLIFYFILLNYEINILIHKKKQDNKNDVKTINNNKTEVKNKKEKIENKKDTKSFMKRNSKTSNDNEKVITKTKTKNISKPKKTSSKIEKTK